jgi:inosose dehydratase
MSGPLARLAGAPITWGVCEVPGWGCQLGTERVLREVVAAGLRAVELGPPGFLPDDPGEVARTLHGYDLRLAAGFVPAVLHRRECLSGTLASVAAAAKTLAAAGATMLVLAAELGHGASGYDRSADLSEPEWITLLDTLDAVRGTASGHGVQVALHPHYGTAVERWAHLDRVIASSDVLLCVDTGHLLVGGVDPVRVIRAANGRVAHVHFKDVDAALAARVREGEVGYRDAVARGLYRPLGDGDVDVAQIVTLLEASKYRGWYVLEQDVVLDAEPAEGDGPAEAAARSVHFLTGIMQA